MSQVFYDDRFMYVITESDQLEIDFETGDANSGLDMVGVDLSEYTVVDNQEVIDFIASLIDRTSDWDLVSDNELFWVYNADTGAEVSFGCPENLIGFVEHLIEWNKGGDE